MKKEINICEHCKKETKDYYSQIGWIRFNINKFSITGGRVEPGDAETIRYFSENDFDFCSSKCMRNQNSRMAKVGTDMIPKSKPDTRLSRAEMNAQSNRLLRKIFVSKNILACEVRLSGCTNNSGLTYAHRKKRRHYRTIEELSDFNEVVLACLSCHQKLEKSPELTMETFERLRG